MFLSETSREKLIEDTKSNTKKDIERVIERESKRETKEDKERLMNSSKASSTNAFSSFSR